MTKKYINYLTDQMKYWKKKLDNTSDDNFYIKIWVEQMYDSFREKIEREKEKGNEI